MSREFIRKNIIPLQKEVFRSIKKYETSIGQFVPDETLNELRYALRAVLSVEEILCNEDDQLDSGSLAQAQERTMHALLCAYHDLVDGLYVDVLRIMDLLIRDFPEVFYQSVEDEFRKSLYSFLDEISNKMADSRGESNSRREVYSQDIYKNYFEKLLEYRKYLMEELMPLVYKQSRKSELERERLQTENVELTDIVEVLKTEKIKAEEDRNNAQKDRAAAELDRELARKNQSASMRVAIAAIILGIILALPGLYDFFNTYLFSSPG